MRLVGIALLSACFAATGALGATWQRYSDPEFGYSVSVPSDGFDVEADPSRNGLTFYEQNGEGQIDVYAVKADDGLNLKVLRESLSQAKRIKQITYSRAGASWFVVSGYYNRASSESTELIFYTKFMISKDRKAVSAFEASYPVSDKRRYDAIIEHIEDSLTAPE